MGEDLVDGRRIRRRRSAAASSWSPSPFVSTASAGGDEDELPADPQRADLPRLEPGWGEPVEGTASRRPRPVGREARTGGEIEIVLREPDRALLLDETLCDPDLVERLRPGRSPGTLIASYTPAELDDLLGFVAAESNHAHSRKLQASLDQLYARLEEFEDRPRSD